MMKNIPVALLMLFLKLSTTACTEPLPPVTSPPGYDLAKPVIYRMPSVLEEISGIAFINGNTDTIYAEQDEEGKLFYFHLGDKEITHVKFSKRGDYEDVAICNGQVVMLRSDGVFFTFAKNEIRNKETSKTMVQPGLLPAGEYESLFADEKNNQVYVLCKNCDSDKGAETVSGYIFSVGTDGKLVSKGNFSIDEKAIATLSGNKKIKLRASGMARNPLSNQWYILSSVNKMLIVTDANWKPLNSYPLNPLLFTQPEGIAFDKAGNLFISNEKGNSEFGTILQFKLQKK